MNKRSRFSDVTAAATWYQTLLAKAPEGLLILDKEGRLVEANDCFFEMHGYAPGDPQLGALADWDASASALELGLLLDRASSGIVNLQRRHHGRDGRRFEVEMRVRGVEMAGERYLCASLREMAEPRTETLPANDGEQRYRRLFEVESDAIMVVDEEKGRFIDVNPAARQLYGYNHEEFLRLTPCDISAEPEQTKWVIATQQTEVTIRRHRRKDGSIFPIEASINYFEEDGKRLHVIAAREITARLQVEEALRDSRRRLDLVFNQSLDGLYFSRLDEPRAWNASVDKEEVLDYIAAHQRITEANDVMVSMYGLSRPEILGRLVSRFFQHDPQAGRRFQRRLLDEGRMRMESSERTAAGAEIWIEGDYLSIHDELGRVIGTFGAQRDITERKRTEAALRDSQKRFTTIFQACPIAAGILRLDNEQITEANDAFLTLFGYSRDEVLGRSPADLGLWPMPEQWQRLMLALRESGHARQVEARFRGKTGLMGDLLITAVVIDLDGIRCVLGMLLNVSEHKKLEERLRQSQKIEGIGHLAGGMAHEFNNILAGMMLNLGLAQAAGDSRQSRELLEDLQANCQRAADLVKQLLAFSRQSVMERKPLDLKATVERQLKMLRPFLGEKLEVELSAPSDLPPASADKSLIEQVVLNLSLNARDAMKGGGKLQLNLTQEEVGPERLIAYPDARVGCYVRLSVTDTGCGMDESILRRLFEPFFTTKEIGKGTGLGLATVRGIIQQHEGWVEVDSRVGHGSTFSVYLPATPSVRTVETSKAAGLNTNQRKGTILSVEDDKLLQKLTRRLLVQNGYTVIEAGNGAEALAMWAAHKSEIDLIYADMVMPGELTGLEIAQRAIREKPGLRAIITSGYNTDWAQLEKASESSIDYLPKPCASAKLLEAISRSLAQVS